jgi:pimeloyl-[acyl-carrier protein] methyl ester esterase
MPSGEPLIFLPGWLATRYWWHRQAEAFAGDYGVLAVDYPAVEGAGPHNVDAYAEWVQAALEGFGRPAILVGWSLGAGVALRMVELFGTGGLRGLVLVDQTPRSLADADWPHNVIGLDEARRVSTLQMVRSGLSGIAETVVRSSFSRDPDPQLLARLRTEALRWDAEAAATLLSDHWDRDYRDAASSIDVPTLLIGGGKSAFTPAGALEFLRDAIPGAKLEMLPDSGHAPFLEEPERFNALLAAFLDRLS